MPAKKTENKISEEVVEIVGYVITGIVLIVAAICITIYELKKLGL